MQIVADICNSFADICNTIADICNCQQFRDICNKLQICKSFADVSITIGDICHLIIFICDFISDIRTLIMVALCNRAHHYIFAL